MPRVSYQPFSTAEPQSPGERIAIQTPGAAFGENIGAALQHLGTTGEQVGSELFSRAIALQDLRNEADARAAQTDFATKSSELHAQYSALTGKDAVDGLQPFLQKQTQLREQIRGGLTSPMSQRYYDSDSLPFMQRNVFSAAGHAADENKRFTIGTLKATTDLDANTTGDSPYDESFVDQKRAKIEADTIQATMLEAGTDNPSSPIVQDAVKNVLSKQRRIQITGIARTDPIAAQEMIDKYNSDLTDTDRNYITGLVEGKAAAVAANQGANAILAKHRQPDGTYDASATVMQQEARDWAKQNMPSNPLLPDAVVGKLDNLQFMGRLAQERDTQDAVKTTAETIMKYNVTDAQQLLAVPGMDKTVQMLPPSARKDLQGYINRFNQSVNTRTSQEQMVTINGLRNNDSAAFMTIDPTDPKFHLSQPDIIKVQNWQHQMAQKSYDDPRVSRSMGWIKGAMAPQLQSLGVYQRDKANPDDYDHFTGALQEALQVWQEDHQGKQPSYNEVVDQIAPSLLNTQMTKKGWIWNSQTPAFQGWNRPSAADIPKDFREQVTKDVVSKGGAVPTEEQLLQAFAREQFIKLYGATGGGAATPKPSAPIDNIPD